MFLLVKLYKVQVKICIRRKKVHSLYLLLQRIDKQGVKYLDLTLEEVPRDFHVSIYSVTVKNVVSFGFRSSMPRESSPVGDMI